MRLAFSSLMAVLCAATILSGSRAAAEPPVINPPPLTTFNGRTWAGMTIGSTTRDDIKKNYSTRGAKGDDRFLRAGALILTPPERDADGDVRAIQTLVDGTRGDARLTGIRLVYGEFAPYVKDVARVWGDAPKRYYAPKRYSDWSIVAFPQRGLALITTDSGGEREESVRMAFLTSARRLQDALNGYSESPTDIGDINADRGLEGDSIVVGGADVNVDVSGLDGWGGDFMRDDIRRQIRDRLSRAHVDIQRGESGSAIVNVKIQHDDDDKEGSISCSASVSGSVTRRDGPQSASASGNGYQSLPKSRKDAKKNLRSRVGNAIDAMISDLDQNVRAAVKKLQPPTPEDYRKGVWDKLIADATK